MLLKKITISNYRCVKDLEVSIEEIADKKCFMFFGINGTGKSNILRAISLLQSGLDFQYDVDCNKKARSQNEKVELNYLFGLEDGDLPKIVEKIDGPPSLRRQIKITGVEKLVSFDKNSKKEDSYNLHFGGIKYDHFIYDSEKNKISLEVSLDKSDESKEILNRLNDPLDDRYTKLDEAILSKNVGPQIGGQLDALLPEVILWKPDPKHLINEPINLEQFRQNLDTSIPLRNIFHLAGFEGEALITNLDRIQKSPGDRAEMEGILSKAITKHLNELWPEHKINISLRFEANNQCIVFVEDKDNVTPKFTMKQRSDGFQHFISILLTLSVENKINQLRNKVILLDEPERSLHPSSVRYLRDELLNIAKNNIVFCASHSIFMVDKKDIDRHYNVIKENGETKIQRVSRDDPLQEEVIYEALGTTIYELIEPNVIIFEGRIDKDLFDTFTRKFKTKIKPSRIKTIFATGVKQIPRYAKFFDQKLVKGFVVVDSDKDGQGVKRTIVTTDTAFKNKTFELKDLVDVPKPKATTEDLLPEEIVLSLANKLYGYTFNSPGDAAILSHIKTIKKREKIHTDGRLEELKKQIVRAVILDIKNKSISQVKERYPLYVEFVKNLNQRVKD
ncbi:MAG: AAA family ATPase [Candidatus Diapherotrites archaeon]|nr:AAA family ATPase [Candidatus Diapherotrites archaeon]